MANSFQLPISYEIVLGASQGVAGGVHMVEFFNNDNQVVNAVTKFVSAGIQAQQVVIIVASKAHNNALTENLLFGEVDVDGLIARGQVVFLDAHATLAALMDGNQPSREKFLSTVGALVETKTRVFRQVRAYGEMVDILAGEGNLDGAIALENLWNELLAKHPFSLLCGYRSESLSASDRSELEKVCGCHTHSIALGRIGLTA